MNERETQPGRDEEAVERTTVDARQGSRNRGNLRVLVVSLGFAALILALIYFLFFPSGLD
ncbi:MAG: hypothetical protein WBB38_15570 [Hyphomicrobiaceae bacterium]|jgi:hypothetical protein